VSEQQEATSEEWQSSIFAGDSAAADPDDSSGDDASDGAESLGQNMSIDGALSKALHWGGSILGLGTSTPAQLDGHTGLDDAGVQSAAEHGLTATGGTLPHLDSIQQAFGAHDISSISAHVGGAAREASEQLGAHAYATGDHVAFAEQPSLFLAAHEAAHVVQQRGGVQLSSAVGQDGDAYEQQADAVASRVVAGESAEDLLGAATDATANSDHVQRKGAAKPTKAPVDPRAAFEAALDATTFNASKATKAWAALKKAGGTVSTAYVDKAIDLLPAASALDIVVTCSDLASRSAAILAEVGADTKQQAAWHAALLKAGRIEEFAAAANGAPGADAIVASAKAKAYDESPETMSDRPHGGGVVVMGKPYVFSVTDEHATNGKKTWKRPAKGPWFSWTLEPTDKSMFEPIAPIADDGPTMSVPLTATKQGDTKVTATAQVKYADGYGPKKSRSYDLHLFTVDIEGAAPEDQDRYFTAKFEDEFRPILHPLFLDKELAKAGKTLSTLFTPTQREKILSYIDTRVVPPGLFTLEQNIASGPQRVLMAAHMLTYGVIEDDPLDPDKKENTKWHARFCGHWANGAQSYAGINFSAGGTAANYGLNSRLSVETPTGETSFGTATFDSAAEYTPTQIDGGKAKQVDAGTSITKDNPNQNLEASEFVDLSDTRIQPGDWVYIDNGGAAGHSVIFVHWVNNTIHEETEPATAAADAMGHLGQRGWSAGRIGGVAAEAAAAGRSKTIKWREAFVYNQPSPESGGKPATIKLGFPHSSHFKVSGVYAITKAPNTQPAHDAGELVGLTDAALAKAAHKNQQLIEQKPLNTKKLGDALKTAVAGKLSAVKNLVEPQLKLANEIIGAEILDEVAEDDAMQITKLVALYQKLAVLDKLTGAAQDPDGLVESTSFWKGAVQSKPKKK
jgi:hypothetical protein